MPQIYAHIAAALTAAKSLPESVNKSLLIDALRAAELAAQ